MALCTQDDVERTLHIEFTDTPEDTITFLIDGASQAIKTWVGRELEEATYTNELYDSEWGRTMLQLREFPVTAVSAVVENGVDLVEGESYEFYSTALARINGSREQRWQVGRKIIDVSYTAGFNPIPSDIVLVCSGIVARHFDAGVIYAATPEGAASGITAVGLEGSDSISYAEPPAMGTVGQVMMLTDSDKSALIRYHRRMVL